MGWKKKFLKLPWPKIGVLIVRACIVVLSFVSLIITAVIYDKTLASMPKVEARLKAAEQKLEISEKEKYVEYALKQYRNRTYESIHEDYVHRNDKAIAGLIVYHEGLRFQTSLDRITVSAVFVIICTCCSIAILCLRWKLPPRFTLLHRIIRIADIVVIILLVIFGLMMYGCGLGNHTIVPLQHEAKGADMNDEDHAKESGLYINICSDLLKGRKHYKSFPLEPVPVKKEDVKCLTEEAHILRGDASLITCITGGIALVLEMFLAFAPRRWDI